MTLNILLQDMVMDMVMDTDLQDMVIMKMRKINR